MNRSGSRWLVIVVLFATPPTRSAPGPDTDALAAVQGATQGRMMPGRGRVDDGDCGRPIEYEAEAVDLDGDGQLEVMTQEFGPCFGMAGVRMNLYIRSRDGRWVAQFGFPGAPRFLETRSHGFPDIEVLGPGLCFPVWRFDGTEYRVVARCR